MSALRPSMKGRGTRVVIPCRSAASSMRRVTAPGTCCCRYAASRMWANRSAARSRHSTISSSDRATGFGTSSPAGRAYASPRLLLIAARRLAFPTAFLSRCPFPDAFSFSARARTRRPEAFLAMRGLCRPTEWATGSVSLSCRPRRTRLALGDASSQNCTMSDVWTCVRTTRQRSRRGRLGGGRDGSGTAAERTGASRRKAETRMQASGTPGRGRQRSVLNPVNWC